MKLSSQTLELRALRSIAVRNGLEGDADVSALATDSTSMISSTILSSVDESFFHTPPARAAYKRILSVAEKRSRIMGYDDLCEDGALSEEYRDILKENKKKRVKTKLEAEDLIRQLDEYRQNRIMFSIAQHTLEKLKEDSVDTSELMNHMQGKLSEARSRENMQDKILTVGRDANAKNLGLRALSDDVETLIKTGIDEFDEKNGGLVSEGVHILASTTSGGKSTMRMNLMKNMYLQSKMDTLTVSLEMSDVKETRRLLSCLSGIEFWKFVKKALKESERQEALKAYKDFHKFGKKNGCRYSIFCPTRSLTIQQLLMLIKPYKFKVIAIDYVSLLEGVDEKDQWKTLSAIVRQCKIFSAENHCLIILLAQLDSEDDRIRYSKGMLEHADSCWTWNYTKPEQRELKELPIQQKKARDGELFPFTLLEEFHIMRVSNPSGDGGKKFDRPGRSDDKKDADEENDSKGKSKKSKGKKEDGKGDETEAEFDVQ